MNLTNFVKIFNAFVEGVISKTCFCFGERPEKKQSRERRPTQSTAALSDNSSSNEYEESDIEEQDIEEGVAVTKDLPTTDRGFWNSHPVMMNYDEQGPPPVYSYDTDYVANHPFTTKLKLLRQATAESKTEPTEVAQVDEVSEEEQRPLVSKPSWGASNIREIRRSLSKDEESLPTISRRHSVDESDVKHNFECSVRRRGLYFRRRNSFDERTLNQYAETLRLMSCLKRAGGRDSTCQVQLRRSGSLMSGELDKAKSLLLTLGSAPSGCIYKSDKHRLFCLREQSKLSMCETLPQTAVTLLSGGQELRERFLYLGHIENLINESPNAPDGDSLAKKIEMHFDKEPRQKQWVTSFRGIVPPKEESKLCLRAGCSSIPKVDKSDGGEDAHFMITGPGGLLGVADGVGQWSDWGCSAREFTHCFIKGCFVEAVKLRRIPMRLAYWPWDKEDGSQIFEQIGDNDEFVYQTAGMQRRPPQTLFPSFIQTKRCCNRMNEKSCLRGFVKLEPNSGDMENGEIIVNDPEVSEFIPILEMYLQPQTDISNWKPSRIAQQVLLKGYDATQGLWGGCTAIAVCLSWQGDNILGIANVGDSSILILRRDFIRSRLMTVYKHVKEQQHVFNCPFQFSRAPTSDDHQVLEERGLHALLQIVKDPRNCNYSNDTTNDADLNDVKVIEGDLLIVATDGLFDNLFDHEIAHICSIAISPYEAKFVHRSESFNEATTGRFAQSNFVTPPKLDAHFGVATPPQAIATGLTQAALFRSMDKIARTPFQRNARKAGRNMPGGKSDDITVIAAWVVSD